MELTITRPDDWHVHFRDGVALSTTVPHVARCFGRAIAMPNLARPVTTTEAAAAYRKRILAAVPEDTGFDPLMTLYLTDNTDPDEIRIARDSGVVHAVKLYPAGATTNSERGVTDLARVNAVLEAMEKLGMPLLVHGETVDPAVDVFDRERVFIDRTLIPLVARFQGLHVVLEHITTQEAVDFVLSANRHVAATLTAHHLLLNRNALFVGGVRPHYYCLPVLKREHHRKALLAAAVSGNPKFLLGSDSAPHALSAKETACGCAGIYTAPVAIELYAEAFEQAGALDQLDAFASRHGADFYKLPRATGRITLKREPWTVPESYPFGDDSVVPLRAGGKINWRVTDVIA
jgi:dihydroorotase